MGCGGLERDNPADPSHRNGGEDDGIDLVASLPPGEVIGVGGRLVHVRYQVVADDIRDPIRGEMNLVGDRVQARVRGVPNGTDRVFRVDAFDVNQIRTYAAADTLDVQTGNPVAVSLSLARLTGSLEISSALPPEVAALELAIAADGDTLRRAFDQLETPFAETVSDIPTGTAIVVVVRARDSEERLLIQKEEHADIRPELLSHLQLSVVMGALEVVARFPDYIPIAEVDRFSDEAGTFFRRSRTAGLPDPGAPIDFDDERFLLSARGPDGGSIQFYHFDVRSPVPAPVYLALDVQRDSLVAGQLPIFDLVPGEAGHNDFWRVHHVRVLGSEYRANSLASLQQVTDAGHEIVATDQVINAVMVPLGSTASRRLDPLASTAPRDGWYQTKIVKYLLFEGPPGVAVIDFDGEKITPPQMYGFFANNQNEIGGFAVDSGTGSTHNVAASLPDRDDYSFLWVLSIFRMDLFLRVANAADAIGLDNDDENKIDLPAEMHINAPIVWVE